MFVDYNFFIVFTENEISHIGQKEKTFTHKNTKTIAHTKHAHLTWKTEQHEELVAWNFNFFF